MGVSLARLRVEAARSTASGVVAVAAVGVDDLT
jgi:hypothetical protein